MLPCVLVAFALGLGYEHRRIQRQRAEECRTKLLCFRGFCCPRY